MVISKLRALRFAKEERDGTKLTYEVIQEATGLSPNTLSRLLKREPLDRIDAQTVSVLCRYFGCGIEDLLEYVPDDQASEVTA
jgi:DNA-binding Xre family transcriptional regulator